jgi:spoIIIJ-associated protein
MERESVEVSAKGVDEAIDDALEELGLTRQQVEIEILTAGKPGLFGFGGEQARVRVTALEEGTARPATEPAPPDRARDEVEIKDVGSPEANQAADYLKELLALMDISGEVSLRAPETPGDGLGRATAVLDVDGEDLGLLIGRRGTTLSSVQYMINLMVSRKTGGRVLFTVDVEHYRRRREESLLGLAHRMADRVRKTGRSITLEPMPAGERRIVHLALADDEDVATGSVGEGDGRKVIIRSRPGAVR